MKRKILWLAVCGLMALSLVMTACGPATTPTTPTTPSAPATPTTPTKPAEEATQKETVKPTSEAPQYGGTLRFVTTAEATTTKSIMGGFTTGTEGLWGGDWAKGPAGGYGSNTADWGYSFTDIWELKTGYVAESWKWTLDEAKDEGTIVYQIRPGMRYALNQKSEAGRLVNGREVTADDVVYSMNTTITDPDATIFRANPELRVAKVSKTGPNEVTVKIPTSGLANAIFRLTSQINIVPPEVITRYQSVEMPSRWKYAVGSGPYMVTDYTPGSIWTYVKNDNYWMTNPIGPGKGDKLPYLDSYQRIIIPDRSTQLAALRTGKIDHMSALDPDEVAQFKKTATSLLQAENYSTAPTGAPLTTAINITRPPFTDVRVRRALFMAIDFQAINQATTGGRGQIINWPFYKQNGYEALYLGYDDPALPASVKELFTYNPEKSKQLLKEAGFPNGFKTTVLTTSTNADFYSILNDYLAKVNIDLTLDLKESAAKTTLTTDMNYDITNISLPPPSIFYVGNAISGTSSDNPLRRTPDPLIEKTLVDMRKVVITKGMDDAIPMMKELLKYVLDQAFAFSSPRVMLSSMWWPWIKNYDGELSGGYGSGVWEQFVWIDQTLKKSMGH